MISRIATLVIVALATAAALLIAPAVWAACAPSTRGIFPASGTVGTIVTRPLKARVSPVPRWRSTEAWG